MQRVIIALLLSVAAAAARAAALPDCAALVAPLEQDPTSIYDSERLLGVDAIVQDSGSTPDLRICTGVGRYRSISTHITYTAKWRDDKRTSVTVDAHTTTQAEAASRARSLRIKSHPSGDGTFLLKNVPAFCTDPDFVRHATEELHYGISAHDAFYQEPGYTIFEIHSNGYDTGVMANCIATVGNATVKGDIFLGTDWVEGQSGRRFQFYVLSAGPQDFQLENRLWEMSAE